MKDIKHKKPYLNDHGEPQFFGDYYEEIIYKLNCLGRDTRLKVFEKLAKNLDYEVK